ncbi:hypothetical protein E2C01_077156 [Portunus trituberculatus]|uniref:Uncharacterized protein n=1 Tax=Portunus trituberculatus TaxID=210409 RepID=A0A5B7IL28_PORTR|nr:hypothetical protein [Portunus trituberculatus]
MGLNLIPAGLNRGVPPYPVPPLSRSALPRFCSLAALGISSTSRMSHEQFESTNEEREEAKWAWLVDQQTAHRLD